MLWLAIQDESWPWVLPDKIIVIMDINGYTNKYCPYTTPMINNI